MRPFLINKLINIKYKCNNKDEHNGDPTKQNKENQPNIANEG